MHLSHAESLLASSALRCSALFYDAHVHFLGQLIQCDLANLHWVVHLHSQGTKVTQAHTLGLLVVPLV